MESFRFDLVTPEAAFFSGDTTMVEAPGTLGDFGVLAGHMPFISTLRPGIITIHEAGERKSYIFVSGGIAEVNPVSCTILAEQVINLDTLSRSDAAVKLECAKKTLDDAYEEIYILRARKEIELAEAMISALENHQK